VETEPRDLDRAELGALVEGHWSVCAGSLERWDLGDIAEFVGLFRPPHERTADQTVAASEYLAGYLRVQ
jgi:hypothetical protein